MIFPTGNGLFAFLFMVVSCTYTRDLPSDEGTTGETATGVEGGDDGNREDGDGCPSGAGTRWCGNGSAEADGRCLSGVCGVD